MVSKVIKTEEDLHKKVQQTIEESKNKAEAFLQYQEEILNLFVGEERSELEALFEKMQILVEEIENKS